MSKFHSATVCQPPGRHGNGVPASPGIFMKGIDEARAGPRTRAQRLCRPTRPPGRAYFRSSTILAGFSRYSFHRLEKRHMVAPSMMRWSADQLTFMMWARTT